MSKWVILWCEKDTSYSLLQDTELICDAEHLSIGDKVKFIYHKTEWDGDVCEVGGECDLTVAYFSEEV